MYLQGSLHKIYITLHSNNDIHAGVQYSQTAVVEITYLRKVGSQSGMIKVMRMYVKYVIRVKMAIGVECRVIKRVQHNSVLH